MENKRPLHWWEEYLGLKFSKKSVAAKTWKAYLGYIATIPLCMSNAHSLFQARPVEADPHTPSQSQQSAEPMRTVMVATTSAASSNQAFVYHVYKRDSPK